MKRADFIARVRDAVASSKRYHVEVGPPLSNEVARFPRQANLLEWFAAEAKAASAKVVALESHAQAREWLADFLRERPTKRAFCWNHPTLARLEVTRVLTESGVEGIDARRLQGLSEDAARTLMFDADLGITSALCGVAESGSLVMNSGADTPRLASLAPPLHIAFLEESQIVADLLDVLPWRTSPGGEATPVERIPPNLTLITGPSKTGDIEGSLVTGVHGPGVIWIVLIRGA